MKQESLSTIKFLVSLFRVSPKTMALFATTQILYSVLTATLAPIFVSQLITSITQGTATFDTALPLLAGYGIILFIGDVVMIRLSIFLAYRGENRMQTVVAQRILRHLTEKSLSFHANRMSGSIVSDSTKLVGAVERFWDMIMFTIVPILATIISVTISLSFFFWQYALTLFVLACIIIVIIIRAQSSVAPSSRIASEAQSKTTAHIADVLANIAAVKAFARADDEQKTFKKLIDNWIAANKAERNRVLIVSGSFGVLMTILNISAFSAAIFATQFHLAHVGIVYLIISYTLSVVAQLWSATHATRQYVRIIGDATPMITTLHEPAEITDATDTLPANITHGTIALQDITFAHEEESTLLFRDFSLKIPAGQRVGLVGHSGSGKTSLTKLLLRFSDIKNGQIVIDDQDISQLKQDDVRRAISYVPQEPLLFHRSLRENIAYGKPDATDHEVWQAAKAAHAHDFIKALPEGLDTIVGERGVKLSGGQRQRIAIARAILKDAPILILDEATSALDSESEKLIQASLETLMKNRTSIVIAHRLSTIAKLDRIVVLENGTIIEDGTHTALLKKNGIYAKLWSHQSGGFIEE